MMKIDVSSAVPSVPPTTVHGGPRAPPSRGRPPTLREITLLSRIVTALLLALAAQPGMAKDTVTLRVGEQNYFNIQASMEASGVLKDLPYTIEWKHFQAAAPVAESLNGNAIDVGFLGDSALLTLARAARR